MSANIETRIYWLNAAEYFDKPMSDNKFISIAELQGNVATVEHFISMLNRDEVHSNCCFFRAKSVEVNK